MGKQRITGRRRGYPRDTGGGAVNKLERRAAVRARVECVRAREERGAGMVFKGGDASSTVLFGSPSTHNSTKGPNARRWYGRGC